MRIGVVTVKQTLGIEDAEFDVSGQITEITGRNASGKTSLMEALQAAIGGGNIASLARVDPRTGEVMDPRMVIVLDDKTRVTFDKNGPHVETPVDTSEGVVYAELKKPRKILDGYIDKALANPIHFITAREERTELFLSALPLTMDMAALWEGLPPAGRKALESADVKQHPLQVLATVRASVYELRTDINRKEKDKAASAKELSASLPADAGRDWAADIAALENQHRALDEQRRATTADAGRIEQTMLEGIEASRATAIEKERAGEKAAYDKLRAATDVRLEAIRKEHEAAIRVIGDAAAGAIQTINDESDAAKSAAADIRRTTEASVTEQEPELQRLAADLATARTKAAESGRVQATRDMATKHAREAEGLKAHAEELTAALVFLDETKAALAKDLPIPGLSIDGKDIRVDGVLYDTLNTARKVEIAVKIATLRAKDMKLPLCFLDGAEVLDSETRALLFAELEASGCQAFVARVTDGPFEVRTFVREAVTA